MIYIENNLDKQDLFIPRNDNAGCYVSPYDKGYQDGYSDGLEDCGAGCTLQEKDVVVTAATQTVRPDSGYVGMEVVSINASQFALEKYTEGYHDGEEDGEQTQKDKLVSTAFTQNGVYTRADGWGEVEVNVADIPCALQDKYVIVSGYIQTVLPSSGYDGMGRVDIDAEQFGIDKFNSGYTEGVADQKAKLSATTITSNDTYTNADGWSAVTVAVPKEVSLGTLIDTPSRLSDLSGTYYRKRFDPSIYTQIDGWGEVILDFEYVLDEAENNGRNAQKALLSSTAITQNGNYSNADGWSAVTVNVPTGSTCNIESGVSFPLNSGFTQTTVTPSSGYDGIGDITIYDNGYGQERYDNGYNQGYNDGISACTGTSCDLEAATYILQSGFTGETIYPSSGYDGMSAVTITDGGYGDEKYNEGYADGAISPCALQDKNVVLTATTECIYPDASDYKYYLGTANAVWDLRNLVDTGVYPTQTSTARLKYIGRGVRSDRLMGSISGYQSCTDNTDYRAFDKINLTLDVGSVRRTVYSISSITENAVVYDITYGNAYIYDNINETYLLQNGTQTVNTGYTYTVDFGSIWIKEFIIEDGGVELYHGVPREVNGVAGLYDTVSNTFAAAYSGATSTPIIQTVAIGYQGLSSVCVDASGIYNQGYNDGKNEAEGNDKYFTFEAIEDGEIGFHYSECSTSTPQQYTALTISYSLNGGPWSSITSTPSSANQITVQAGDVVRFKGTNGAYYNHSSEGCGVSHKLINTNSCYVYGNIMSLVYGDNFEGQDTLTERGAFHSFFSGNQNIYFLPNKPLSLPATTLSRDCYASMFLNSNITSAPKLPATTLTPGCYEWMFRNCSNLTTAPSLPATTVAASCYLHMFHGCTSLIIPPALPATTLEESCYAEMFEGCTSLITPPELPATTLARWCYMSMFVGCTSLMATPILPASVVDYEAYASMFADCTSITTIRPILATEIGYEGCSQMFAGCTSIVSAPTLSATTLGTGSYWYMFSGCTSLTTAPSLPATTLAGYCYANMFKGCTSLTTAPELPATQIGEECYEGMFKDCTNLNYIKCLATQEVGQYSGLTDWVDGVSASGTFVKDANASFWTTGNSGIPSGWTVQNIQ